MSFALDVSVETAPRLVHLHRPYLFVEVQHHVRVLFATPASIFPLHTSEIRVLNGLATRRA